jgi:phosphatidate phosphatase
MYKIPSSKTLLSRILLELVTITILGYPMLHIYVFLRGNLEPYGRGFFCDDQNLKHPFKEEEISISECVIIWFGIVLVVLPSVEALHFAMFEYKEWESQMKSRKNNGCLGCFSRIPVILIELYRILGYFFIGGLGCLLTTELAKYKIGRLRPYYLTVCNINLTKDLCEDEFGYKKFVEPPHNCVARQGDPNPLHTDLW